MQNKLLVDFSKLTESRYRALRYAGWVGAWVGAIALVVVLGTIGFALLQGHEASSVLLKTSARIAVAGFALAAIGFGLGSSGRS